MSGSVTAAGERMMISVSDITRRADMLTGRITEMLDRLTRIEADLDSQLAGTAGTASLTDDSSDDDSDPGPWLVASGMPGPWEGDGQHIADSDDDGLDSDSVLSELTEILDTTPWYAHPDENHDYYGDDEMEDDDDTFVVEYRHIHVLHMH
jgi:hypothetical protein